MSDPGHEQPKFELLANSSQATLADILGRFEPMRLTQARVLAELTKPELAERIGVSATAIGHYEAGATRPRPDLLPTIARVLDVPVEYFATGRPLGRLDAAEVHFRSLRSTRAKDRAKAAAYAGQLWELVYTLETRVRFPERDLPEIAEGASPVEAARRLREHWGIGRGPIAHLGATLESRGIVISLAPHADQAVARVSAYSTDALGRPLIVIASERVVSVCRYRFTCAHELGHLLLHPNPLPGDLRQEREADEFAAEFLTPRAEIGPLLPSAVRIDELGQLGRQWGVAVESLIHRMGELDLASETALRGARQRLAATNASLRDELLAAYPGECPSLLIEALALAAQRGFGRAELVAELCWAPHRLAQLLGEADTGPRLTLAR